jgi:hypothetical protein
MLHALVDARLVVAMVIACAVGLWGLHRYPIDTENVFLAQIQLEDPSLFRVLSYGYATLWFTTPFLAASLAASLLGIVVYGRPVGVRMRALPPYPRVEDRDEPFLVLGERHFTTRRGHAPDPHWLRVRQRGLYTGVMVVGAVAPGKRQRRCTPSRTSSCAGAPTIDSGRWGASSSR